MNEERRFIQPESPAQNDPSPDRSGTCARCERMDKDDARDVEMLRELAALGMDMARAVQGQVMEQIAAGKQVSVGGDPGLVFSRIAKTVRQAIALKRKIAEEADARQHRTAEQQAAHRAKQAQEAAWAESDRINNVKARVERGVERLIIETPKGDYENLFDDLYDRMDDYEAEGEFARGTVDELIVRIAEDLGYTFESDDDDEPVDEAEPETSEAEPAAVEDDPPSRSLYPARKGRYPPS